MPWGESRDYERPIRVRDTLGIISLLLIFLIAYELIPAPKHPPSPPAAVTGR